MGIDLSPFRDLYPFKSHYLDRRGLRYHYLDEGGGEPIVMVHGNPTWSFYFRGLVKGLRGLHRCIVPDHIGCGLSDKPGDDRYEYVLQRRVEDLEALLDHLGLDHGVTLVVHDWGGMIGMAVALRRPERIARMVVMNTAGFLMPAGKSLPLRLWAAHGRNPLSSVLVRWLNLFAWGAGYMASARGLLPGVRKALRAPYNSWHNRIAVHRFVQDIPLSPGHRSYELVKWVDDNLYLLKDKPMLLCWGARDFVFDSHFLEEWRRRFPKAEVHLFPHAGHFVMEDADEEIPPLIRGFIDEYAVGDHRNEPIAEDRG